MGCKGVLDKSKKKHKKGLWSPDEDQKLRNYVLKHGHGCWSSVPVNAGIKRSGKSCRLRWINYLRPGLKRGAFSMAEEDIILTLHQVLGNKWSQIAHHLPGRTDNEIKNYWHTYLKKRAPIMAETESHLTNDQIQILETESSPSSLTLTAQNSSVFDSSEQIERSTDHETMQQKVSTNLPKVLFTEWLSFDQFSGQDFGYNCASVRDFKDTLNNNSSNLEDALVHGNLLVNEGTFDHETNTMICNVDDMLQSPFKFEYLVSENGLVDYFPGEFCMNYDDMYA